MIKHVDMCLVLYALVFKAILFRGYVF